MEILLLIFKVVLFVSEIVFTLWKQRKEKALNAEFIQRLDNLEKEVKTLKS